MCPRVKPKAVQPAKLWILLVGVNQYQDQQNLSSLQYSALDCQGLGEALTEATASFTNKEVIIHHDFISQRPRLTEVQQSIEHITNSAGKDDTILFYFSGHGILETKTQQVVLCLADTDTRQLLTTGLPLNTLLQQLSSCAASQQLVWLDACHSGGMTLRGTATLADPSSQLIEVLRHKAAQSKGFYALLSCDQTQQSWEFPELGHGVFTYYLMRGLRGEAADSQGVIEADALYQYVYHQTLRYIDKTNQQIRLINQQKSSRGERKLQSEFPLQTPKRIVEGFGKVILGKQTTCNLNINPRQALVVDGGFKASSTTLALSQVLQSVGEFNLRYFPQTNESWSQVKGAIATCLNAVTETKAEISTALLYLRGQVETTDTGSWLILQDGVKVSRFWLRKVLQASRATQQIVILDCPGSDSLQDWVEDLRLPPDRGQCLVAANASLSYSQQFADVVLETLQNADRNAELPVAAWISQLQMALAGTKIVPQIWLSGSQGVIELLTAHKGTDDSQPVFDLGICPYMGLKAFDEASSEYFYGRKSLVQKLVNQISHKDSLAVVGASGSGKSSAVQAGLMAKLRQGKQIPGSDRWWLGCFRPGSQPIEALAKLLTDATEKESQTKQQLQLEGLLYEGVEGFVQWLRTRSEPMVVLIIDQFEELFTLATENERQEFIELILGAVKYAGDRFKLVLTIRADFVASCLENPALAAMLQQNSVLVPPYLTEADYRHAILKPAEQVGLKIEPGLVEILLQDLDRSAGDLPLLQFALQQLWERREQGQLTLKTYQELEGVKGALERQAEQVYNRLDPQSQACARWIFLNLTQLGEGTEDTRRRITKSELIVDKYPAPLVEQTLRTLTDAKLLVVNLDHGAHIGHSRSAANPPEDDELFLEAMSQEATVEVVHEILIRHWSSLRWWLEENRTRLRSQRQIEQAATLWLQKDKQDDFLLQGVRLAEAEEILISYTDELSDTAKEYVAGCIDAREAEQKAAKKRLRQAQLTATALGILGLAATVFGVGAYRQKVITQVENINSLTAVAEAQLLSHQQLESLTTSVKAGKQFTQIKGLAKLLVGQDWQATEYKISATLQQSIYGTQELNRLEGHSQRVNAITASNNGKLLATASDDDTVKIWSSQGTLLKTLTKEQAQANSVITVQNSEIETAELFSIAPDKVITAKAGSYTIAANDDTTVELKSDRLLVNSYSHPQSVNNIALSTDEQLLATSTIDGRIHIWNRDGIQLQTLTGHTGEVTDLEFVTQNRTSGYKLVSTGVDKTTRVWRVFDYHLPENLNSIAVSPIDALAYATVNAEGKIALWQMGNKNQAKLIKTLPAHEQTISQINYSPDGEIIASASWDQTIKLWHYDTGKLITSLNHQAAVNTVAFSRDRQILISGTEDNLIYIWNISDLEQPKVLKTLTKHTDSIKTVALSIDGKLIASAGYDKTINLWTIEGELLQTIEAHNLAITSLAFTPDSKTLASGSWDNTVKLWSIADAGKNYRLLHNLTGHQDGITTISLNAPGTVLASGSGDRNIKLWNTKTGELIKNLRGHTSQINTLAFSSDDRAIISGESQQGLYSWNLALDDLTSRGCDRLSDYLTTNPHVKQSERNLCR
ncbi:MAG: caspase family protein [Cyanobacteria bacterium J06621_12]